MDYQTSLRSMKYTRLFLGIVGIYEARTWKKYTHFILYRTGLIAFTALALYSSLGGISRMEGFFLVGGFDMMYSHIFISRNKYLVHMFNVCEEIHRVSVKNAEGQKIMEEVDNSAVRFIKTVFAVYICYPPFVTIISMMRYAIFHNVKLPYPFWAPDMHIGWIWLYQNMMVLFPWLMAIAYFAALVPFMLIICGSMKCLGNLLENRPSGNAKEYDRDAIQLHQGIIRFVDAYNMLFGHIGAKHFLITSVLLGLLGYQAAKEKDRAEFTVSCVMFFLILGLTFLFCQCGQILESEGQNLFRSAYEGNWYDSDVTSRKTLLLIMTATTKQQTYNYRGIVKVNLEKFSAILRGAYSYLMLLLQMEI